MGEYETCEVNDLRELWEEIIEDQFALTQISGQSNRQIQRMNLQQQNPQRVLLIDITEGGVIERLEGFFSSGGFRLRTFVVRIGGYLLVRGGRRMDRRKF